jgi:membrane-associated phospholipid phosphatase
MNTPVILESGILQQILAWDRAAFTYINSDHSNAFFDVLMPILRNQTTWYPLYALLLVYVIWKFKKQAIIFILFAAATVALCDQISSSILKPSIARVRPCKEPLLQSVIHLRLAHCPGNGSFTSSHAANHFGIAAFIIWCLVPYWGKKSYMFWLWAAVICYAQVYVGVHYPGDILGGAVLGILIGTLVAKIYIKYFNFKPFGNALKANCNI